MEIKGTAVIAIRDFVKSNYDSRYREWVDTLPTDSKSIFTGAIDSTKWYPLKEGGIAPTRKIGDLFFKGNHIQGSLEAGNYSAQKALTGIYKIFVKAASPSYIIERASRIFSTYYRPCEMELAQRGDNAVVLIIKNVTYSDEVIEYRIAGWIERALEISGAQKIKIDFPKSAAHGDAYTEMKIRWE